MAWTQHALPALSAIFIWWLSTGLVLYLNGLPRRTYAWSMLGATGLLGVALFGLFATRTDTSMAGAYLAFLSGLTIWAWHEMSFLMGFLTGSRKTECPLDCGGWRRLVYATQTLLHHEIAIAITALGLGIMAWNMPNQIALWTFMILWGMRLSAKFNVFLGVPNLTEEFLPEHLTFLRSYFRNRPMNILFPLSVTIPTVIVVHLANQAFAAEATVFQAVGATLLGTLLILAILEHWLLVLPLRDAALWSWAQSPQRDDRSGSEPEERSVRENAGPGLERLTDAMPVNLALNSFRQTGSAMPHGAAVQGPRYKADTMVLVRSTGPGSARQ